MGATTKRNPRAHLPRLSDQSWPTIGIVTSGFSPDLSQGWVIAGRGRHGA